MILSILLAGTSLAHAASGPSKTASGGDKIVIAHRSAAGYVAEHTLPGMAMAYAQGADYLEPDVVLTKDGIPVVLHDIQLETTTDVAKMFPERRRADGHWYAIDLTLAEVKRLSVHERTDEKTGTVVFPGRFPLKYAIFQVPTFEEMIQLVQGLNKSTGHNVGLYPELKAYAFHRAAGFDIAKVVIDMLSRYGYKGRDARIYLQAFDPEALRYTRHTLKSQLKMVQLIGENNWHETDADYDAMRTERGLKEIATYADGIGPSLPQVVEAGVTDGKVWVKPTPLVGWAHAAGLVVHPYTVRADELPKPAKTIEQVLEVLYLQVGVDGVFSDFPDRTVAFLKAHGLR